MRVTIKRAQRVLRRKPRQPPRVPSQRSAAAPAVQPLYAYRQAFVEWTVARGLSPQTAKLRASALDMFIVWCGERGLTRPQDITRPILQRYQVHLYHYRKPKGKDSGAPLTIRTQATRLLALVAFFKWLVRDNHLLTNPAADLELPRLPRRLPQRVLTVAEAEGILNLPDLATPQGVRNRAILETLYSTGIRRAELTGLALYDADPREGTLMVREGKGRRDRLLPLGARACAWLERYLTEVRPQLVCGADRGALFLTDYGEPFEKNRLGDLVRRYLRQAGIDKGSCHAFRHRWRPTCSTTARTSASFRRCWGIRNCRPRRFTRRWRSASSRRCMP